MKVLDVKAQGARRQSKRCKASKQEVQGVKARGASYDAGQGRVIRICLWNCSCKGLAHLVTARGILACYALVPQMALPQKKFRSGMGAFQNAIPE
jgi:hypothetical protein